MNCHEARAVIAQGDVPSEHLSSCAQCRAYAEDIARLGTALAGLVMQAPEMRLVLPVRRKRQPVLLAAAILLGLFLSALGAKLIFFPDEVVEPNPPRKKLTIMDGKPKGGSPPPPTVKPR